MIINNYFLCLWITHACILTIPYTEKLLIAIYVLVYNNNYKKYEESKENRGATVIIPSGLNVFRSQNTKDSRKKIDQ